ncbi:MAG: glycosyltransferase [Bacteroidetes bacterium]|nr:glycosyltransferase [Bacteroidota bacterium]
MKILMLADPGSAHTIKWVNYLVKRNIQIFLFGLSEFNVEDYPDNQFLNIESLKIKDHVFAKADGALSKFYYLIALPKIKRIIKEFNPDILHSHYASSYGLLGALTGFHPFIISVYGSDVYNFPTRNYFSKIIFKYNLSKADKILSTSKIMTVQIRTYTNKQIEVTPFGIDINIFQPCDTKERLFNKNDFVIGTVKTLEDKYGIEYLIRAFKIVKDNHPELPLKLLLVGKGYRENYFKKLVDDLGITDATIFTGYVNPNEIQIFHNMIDISVFVSNEESFGVSVLEASACGKPVVVSNIGGLPEIVENNFTGIIVHEKNVKETTEAIEKLLMNKELRTSLGKNGRERVIRCYNIQDNVQQVIDIYKTVIDK